MLYSKELLGWLTPNTSDELAYTSDQGSGLLRRLFMAFSKEGQRVRVQEVLTSRQEELWEAVEQGGAILICGSTEMGKSVIRLLDNLAVEKGKPLQFIQELQASGRLAVELWG
jgi:sulfite reductase alpha subunit-like flavoprotein